MSFGVIGSGFRICALGCLFNELIAQLVGPLIYSKTAAYWKCSNIFVVLKCSFTVCGMWPHSCTSLDWEASRCSEDYWWYSGVGVQSQCQAQTFIPLAEERRASGPHGGEGFFLICFFFLIAFNDKTLNMNMNVRMIHSPPHYAALNPQ